MTTNAGLALVSRAADFAARRHVGDRRKGSGAEPYINHLAEVALLLSDATAGGDPVLIASGWLHDTLEDTPTTREELERLFGEEVAALVAEVTDDKSLAPEDRKRLQVERTPHKSTRARMLKIADKTSNLRSITHSPPEFWSRERMSDYVDWGQAVVKGCRGLNTDLEAAFDAAVEAAREAIAGRN
jgi:(p)ppGpp synthase/HD superfamily hydrolase